MKKLILLILIISSVFLPITTIVYANEKEVTQEQIEIDKELFRKALLEEFKKQEEDKILEKEYRRQHDSIFNSYISAIKENYYVGITEDSIKVNVKVEGNVLSQCINHALISVQFSLVDAYNNKINEKAELIKDCKKNLYRDFYLSSYFIQKTKIETVYINNQYAISLSLNVALNEFESFREKEPYSDALFSNLYESNVDFRNFVSRKLTEVK